MKVINLTPHSITFFQKNLEEHNTMTELMTVPPCGQLARVTTKTVVVSEGMPGLPIPVTATEFGEVEGLPAPEEDTIYIVSSIVAQRCRDRNDVFIPNESVRDENGRIIGCCSLGRV